MTCIPGIFFSRLQSDVNAWLSTSLVTFLNVISHNQKGGGFQNTGPNRAAPLSKSPPTRDQQQWYQLRRMDIGMVFPGPAESGLSSSDTDSPPVLGKGANRIIHHLPDNDTSMRKICHLLLCSFLLALRQEQRGHGFSVGLF